MTDLLVAAGVAPREKFTTIYSGMEVEPFLDVRRTPRPRPPRARLRGRTTSSSARSPGCFISRGTTTSSRAARRRRATRIRNVRFLFVGDGILRDAARSANRRRRARPTASSSPASCRRSGSPSCSARWIIVVHTSLREGLARVLPQALIAGKPVISYDVDGAREVVRDGVNRLSRCRRATSARSPRASSNCPSRRRFADQLAAAGRDECRTRFDHREMTRQIRALYERLLLTLRPACSLRQTSHFHQP